MLRVTSYALRKGSPTTTRADVVVIGVVRRAPASGRRRRASSTRGAQPALDAAPGAEAVQEAYGKGFGPMLTSMGFSGRPGEVLRVPSQQLKSAQLVVVGLGEADALTTEGVRRAAGVAARNLGNAASVVVALPAGDAEHLRAVLEGFASGLYRFAGYRSGPVPTGVADVVVLTDTARRKESVAVLDAARVLGELTAQARDWVNTPPNDLGPTAFAAAVQAMTAARASSRLTVEVLDAEKLAELGCGGILGVGHGSEDPPCLVKLTWKPKKARGHVALVGKGITYDSGGLTIKPSGSMATMKNDMAGAAAVIAAVQAVAELDLPVAVTAWAPMAENMISGGAMRPGDVLTMHSGKTVEVLNTDAEGRLVLADALSMAAAEVPDAIVEISTLTGPCVVALGDRIAGLFGDDPTTAEVSAAAGTTGELLWRLPVPEWTSEAVRTESKVADLLQHNWVRWGSALWAAAFLAEFVGEVPFAHLDIAGPAWNGGSPWGHVPAGATGFGVATLVEIVAARARD